MKIASSQFINIMMIYKHLGSEIFDVVLEPHTITGSATRHTDLILKSLNFPKKL